VTWQIITSSGIVATDLKLVAAVRDASGDRVQFRLDAHRAYDIAQGRELCTSLEPGSVQCVVDPLASGEPHVLAPLRNVSSVPLAVSSSITTPADIVELRAADAASLVLVDPVVVGGLLRARECAAVAQAAGLAASLTVEGTSGLALAATLQLASATPGFDSGHQSSFPQLQDDILTEPLPMADGLLRVPAAPGFGVDVDRDKLELYQV